MLGYDTYLFVISPVSIIIKHTLFGISTVSIIITYTLFVISTVPGKYHSKTYPHMSWNRGAEYCALMGWRDL
jgi:hypothetical protein